MACGLASCALLLHHPVTAQSGFGIAHADLSLTSVHHYVAHEAIPTQLASPPNLLVPQTYRPLIDAMLRKSPTFRRQCMRIAAEPKLVVRLAIGTAPLTSEVRAMTQITRDEKGQVSAVVHIGRNRELTELIAHELEHVIEQLDGVDLAARAALPHTGVTAIAAWPAMFETTRAKRTGLKVVSEIGP